jgi:hypothetical protein
MNKVYWCKGQSKRANTTISINFRAEEEWQYTEDPITFQILLQSISTVHLKWSWKLKVANTKTQRVNALRWIGKALTNSRNKVMSLNKPPAFYEAPIIRLRESAFGPRITIQKPEPQLMFPLKLTSYGCIFAEFFELQATHG